MRRRRSAWTTPAQILALGRHASSKCEHRFHGACLLPWLRERNTCPVCRCQVESVCHRYNRGHSRDLQGPQSEPSKHLSSHIYPAQDIGSDSFSLPRAGNWQGMARTEAAAASGSSRERLSRGTGRAGTGGISGTGAGYGVPDLACSRRSSSSSLLQRRLPHSIFSTVASSRLLLDSSADECHMQTHMHTSFSAAGLPHLSGGGDSSAPPSLLPLLPPHDNFNQPPPSMLLCASTESPLRKSVSPTPPTMAYDAWQDLYGHGTYHDENEVVQPPSCRGGSWRHAKRSRGGSKSPRAGQQAKRRRSDSPL